MIEYLCDGDLGKIPKNTTHLTFELNFNRSVNNLPNSITHLTFGCDFNQSVDSLPISITHLTFGNNFNQSVDNLPNSIKYLTFGFDFDQPIDNLPNSIIHLTFGHCFSQKIDTVVNYVKIFIFKNYYFYCQNKEKLKRKMIIFIKDRCNYYKFNGLLIIGKNIQYYHYVDIEINDIVKLHYFIHYIFFKKLTEYVFNPRRLLRFSKKYNLTLDEYIDFL